MGSSSSHWAQEIGHVLAGHQEFDIEREGGSECDHELDHVDLAIGGGVERGEATRRVGGSAGFKVGGVARDYGRDAAAGEVAPNTRYFSLSTKFTATFELLIRPSTFAEKP